MARDLEAWQRALADDEADLERREEQARQEHATAQELAAFAVERDRLSDERDALADAWDARARERDVRALDRDVAGSGRDRTARQRAEDLDEGALDRFASGEDRDFSAGDRGDSYDDRARAATARNAAADNRRRAASDRSDAADQARHLQEALKSRLQIGQAQGLLMARHALTPDQAFRLLAPSPRTPTSSSATSRSSSWPRRRSTQTPGSRPGAPLPSRAGQRRCCDAGTPPGQAKSAL